MCKLAAITGATPKKTAQAFISTARALFAHSQPDGFGFVAASPGHPSAVGRYLDPQRWHGFGADRRVPKLWKTQEETKGEVSAVSSAIVCHGRTSTNSRCLANVHPFSTAGVHLAHNGILSWKGKKKEAPASRAGCDSDEFLTWYVKHGGSMEGVSKAWSGYGAIFALDDSTCRLRLIKCSTARMNGIRRKGRGWVFATDAGDLAKIVRRCKIATEGEIFSLPRCIVDFAEDGEIADAVDWSGFGSSVGMYATHAFQTSFGLAAPTSTPAQPFRGANGVVWEKNADGRWVRKEEAPKQVILSADEAAEQADRDIFELEAEAEAETQRLNAVDDGIPDYDPGR